MKGLWLPLASDMHASNRIAGVATSPTSASTPAPSSIPPAGESPLPCMVSSLW